MAELAADTGADLRNLFDRTQAVQARHQRIAQRVGNRERRQRRSQIVAQSGVRHETRLDNGLGQLFHEQWNAVCFRDDLQHDLCGQRLAARYAAGNRLGLRTVEAIKSECGHLREPGPRGLEFRAVSNDQQHAPPLKPRKKQLQKFQRCWIGPVQVFEEHQHRARCGCGFDEVVERTQGLLFLLLRTQTERTVTHFGGQRQQPRDKIHVALGLPYLRKHQLEPIQPCFGRIVAIEFQHAVEAVDDGVERGVGKVR